MEKIYRKTEEKRFGLNVIPNECYNEYNVQIVH